MAFAVNAGLMQNLQKLLQLSANTSKEAQAQVRQVTEQLQQHPEWMPHLCAVLTAPNAQCDRYQRQLAGIMLKNFVKRHYGTTSGEAREHVKRLIVRSLGDEHTPVRRAAAVVIGSVVQKEEGFGKWPGLLEGLVQALGNASSPSLQDGALFCVELLCEDLTRELEDNVQRPLNALVPVLVRLMAGGGDVPRLRALRSLNAFVVDWPNAMKVNATAFLEAVFVCANSPDVEVCREVCRTFNTLCDVKPDLVSPIINSVAAFMLAQTGKKKESDLQCEAMEFWQVLAEQVMWHDTLKTRVPQLLPLLLDGIMYDSEDVEALLELDDAAQPLAERHIAPWFAKSRKARGKDDEAAEDKAAADPSMAWSLRKAAAAALDAVCAAFGDPILGVLMPLLRERLAAPRWAVREAAILALGAAAEGTINGLVPLLGGLVGSLLQVLEAQQGQQHVLVVASACWTLGRVSSWIVRQPQDNLLERTVRALAGHLASPSRRIQEGAASCLAVVCEETWAVCKRVSDTNTLLAPLLLPSVNALMNALPRYQAKNLLIGYDLLGSLLRGVPRESVPKLGGLVWPVLLRACTTTPPDRRLVALLDCIATAILSLGNTVAPHAAPLLSRSLQLGLAQLRAAADRGRQEAGLLAELRASRPDCTPTEASDVVQSRLGASSFDVDFAIVALDMCGSVCEALGPQCVQALAPLPLADLLRESVSCADSGVRQAAFGLVGDLSRYAWDQLLAAVSGALLGPLLDCLYGSNVSLCMNASWALGEMCMRMQLPPAVTQEAVARLKRVLCRDHDGPLLRNVAITLCRLAPSCAQLLSSTLHEIGPYWLAPLGTIKPGPDRDRSHEVALKLFLGNLPVALGQLPRLCALMHSWAQFPMPPAVKATAKELFGALMSSPEWPKRWQAVAPEIQQYVQKTLQ